MTSLSSMYARLQQTAVTMMQGYGQQITLVQQGPTSYDPAAGKNTTTTTTYVGQGVLVDFSMSSPSVTTMRGTEVQQGDKRLLLSMQATLNGAAVQMPQPGTNDQIIDAAGNVYSVEATTTTDPSGATPIVHEAHIRGITTS